MLLCKSDPGVLERPLVTNIHAGPESRPEGAKNERRPAPAGAKGPGAGSRAAHAPIASAFALRISSPADPLEREADRIADAVVRSPARGLSRAAAGPAPEVAPPIVQEVLASSGRPLDERTRAYFEPRLGVDLSAVRVHDDARAAESARAVTADGYAVGSDIVFAAGRHAPGTQLGDRLIAHELAHVVQTPGSPGPIPDAVPMAVGDDEHEREARAAAASVMAGSLRLRGAVLRRQSGAGDLRLAESGDYSAAVGKDLKNGAEGLQSAYTLLNGLSMRDILRTGQSLQRDQLRVLTDNVGRARGVFVSRLRVGLWAARAKGEVTLESFVTAFSGDLQQIEPEGVSEIRELLVESRKSPAYTGGPAATVSPAAAFWWPSLVGRPISAEERDGLKEVVRHRASLPIHPAVASKVEYPKGSGQYPGYQYMATGKAAAPSSGGRLARLALAEFYATEAGFSGVVTYDKTLSFGPGFADAAAAQWLREWFDHDKDAETAFVQAGATVARRGSQYTWLAVDDAANILEGEPARQFLRESQKLLSLYIMLTESAKHTTEATRAQVGQVQHDLINMIRPDLRSEMESWPSDAAVAATLHLHHWLPAGGPVDSPNRYVGTNGDPFKIAKGFAQGLGFDPNWRAANVVPHEAIVGHGAIVIGATVQTAGAVEHYFGKMFGSSVPGGTGYLKAGVESRTRVTMSVEAAWATPAFADHVLYVGPGQSGAPPARNVPVTLWDLDK